MKRLRRAFTLVEVNLAVFVMATGVLGMCSLYMFGFREGRQNVEDVAGLSFADEFLAPLAAGLSQQTVKWSDWCKIGDSNSQDDSVGDAVWPANGWFDYVDVVGSGCRVKPNCNAVADQVLSKMKKYGIAGAMPSVGDFKYALVVTRKGACVQLAFRAARRAEFLLSQPVVVAEVRYQGDPEQ